MSREWLLGGGRHLPPPTAEPRQRCACTRPDAGRFRRAAADLEQAELWAGRDTLRRRLRTLVDHIDTVVGGCEDAHLAGIRTPTDQLAAEIQAVYAEARHTLAMAAARRGRRLVDRVAPRGATQVGEFMDALWTIQAVAFDLLTPLRGRLSDNDDDRSLRREPEAAGHVAVEAQRGRANP